MSRKILPIILILTIIFSLLGFNPASHAIEATGFEGGSGSEADPWQIATAVQLNNVRNYLGPEYDDQYFILTADIDLGVYPFNSGEGWEPIGDWATSSDYFYGNFDGGGKTISNLFIDMSDPIISGDSPAGLFGVTYNTTVKNINLANVDVRGYNCVGGLVGDAEFTIISDTHVTGSVTGNYFIGGFAGYTGESYITFTSFNGSVTGVNDIGGLVGYQYTGSIRYSLSKGFVNGNCDIGGLVGINYISTIFDSHSESSVTGIYDGSDSSSDIGGLVGYNYSNSIVSKSYATGNVIGTDAVGGLVGENSSSSKITDSYALGNVSSDAVDTIEKSYSVGGLVGSASGSSTIENCYAAVVVSGTGEYHGGLVGINYYTCSILSSYSLGPDNGNGSVVSPEQMQMASTFDGWNFYDIWVIDEGYPHLLPGGLVEIVSLRAFSQINVSYGTPLSDVVLPFMVFATLSDTDIVPMRVTWDGGNPAYDASTAGDYALTGTLTLVDGIANTSELTASITVTVLPLVKEIISVGSLTDIKVTNGTEYYQIAFPSSVAVTLDDGSTTSLAVSWDEGTPAYDGNTDNSYAFKGTLATESGIANTAGLFASVTVIVETPSDAPPVILYQLSDEYAKVGGTATFLVEYTARPEPNIQWQFSKNGGKRWNDIPGANSSTYEVTQATIDMDGYIYRVILDNGVGTPVISNPAKLTVNYGEADLQISQQSGIYDPATKEIVWNILLYNDGPDTAQGVVIKDTLASNTKLLSVNSAFGYSVKGKTVTINVGELEAHHEVAIEIRVQVTRASSVISNTAVVSTSSLDIDTGNNSSISEVLIQ